jgi:hypothetical protein
MSRAKNHADEPISTPTWEDIAEGLGGLEREYGGHAEVCMDKEGVRGSVKGLWVYVKLYANYQVWGTQPKHTARSLWPTRAHKTMTGCILKLIHSVDHMADAQRRAELEDLPF